MNDQTKTGKCFCGNISFKTVGDPLWVAHCHCNSCRRNTGAPVTTFVGFNKQQVSFDGERAFYASSPGVRRGFCAQCGTPMTYESTHVDDEVHFYISVMDDPESFVPERHVFHAEHIAWLELYDELPRHSGVGRGNEPSSWGPKRSGA